MGAEVCSFAEVQMQVDSQTHAVTQMDPHEVALFVLYRAQLAAGGRTRDDLPYTAEFDNLRTQYNQQTPPQQVDQFEFWGMLRYVLKYGEEHMEAYLLPLGVTVQPKP